MEIIQAVIIFFSVFINLKKASEKKLNVSSNTVIHGATAVGYTPVHQSAVKSSNFSYSPGFYVPIENFSLIWRRYHYR